MMGYYIVDDRPARERAEHARHSRMIMDAGIHAVDTAYSPSHTVIWLDDAGQPASRSHEPSGFYGSADHVRPLTAAELALPLVGSRYYWVGRDYIPPEHQQLPWEELHRIYR